MAIYVSAGVISADLTIADDRLFVLSGGEALRTTVNAEGYMYVKNGGVANSTTVNSYGEMYVSSGGVAEYISTDASYYDYNALLSGKNFSIENR